MIGYCEMRELQDEVKALRKLVEELRKRVNSLQTNYVAPIQTSGFSTETPYNNPKAWEL